MVRWLCCATSTRGRTICCLFGVGNIMSEAEDGACQVVMMVQRRSSCRLAYRHGINHRLMDSLEVKEASG